MDKKVEQAIEILKQEDKKYIKNVLMKELYRLEYDWEYEGWVVGDEPASDFIYRNENTLLNPKELEGVIDEVIDKDIFPVDEIAVDFISYYEAKWGLDDLTEDKISSKITGDAEFHMFELAGMDLCGEVIKQLKVKGVEIKEC